MKSRILILLACTLLLAACGGKEGRVFGHSRDKEAYALGRRHASEVVAVAADEDLLQDRLLDVRARISNIDSKLGHGSAADYEAGFTDGIREECDSLAKILF